MAQMTKPNNTTQISLSDEDWTDIFSEKFSGEDTQMDLEEFKSFMHGQLKLYVQRHIASALLEAETRWGFDVGARLSGYGERSSDLGCRV